MPAASIKYMQVETDSCDYHYTIRYFAGGPGDVVSGGYVETTFLHTLNLEEVAAKYPNRAELIAYLERYFWDIVNPDLDNPYIQDESYFAEKKEVEFTKGSREELDRLVKLILTVEDPTKYEDLFYVTIYAETDNEYAHLDEEIRNFSPHIQELLKLALAHNNPMGEYLEYNDNSRDRQHSYDWWALALNYELDPFRQLPGRDRMNARKELYDWLVKLELPPDHYGIKVEEKVL